MANIKFDKSFIESCLDDDAALFELDDFIEYWHTHDTDISLKEFIGMTDYEYEQWGKSSDAILRDILYCRQNNIEYSDYNKRKGEQTEKRGRWVRVIGDDYECSNCKAALWARKVYPVDKYKFCWSCGAKMDLPETN